jgi:hypothetical protein
MLLKSSTTRPDDGGGRTNHWLCLGRESGAIFVSISIAVCRAWGLPEIRADDPTMSGDGEVKNDGPVMQWVFEIEDGHPATLGADRGGSDDPATLGAGAGEKVAGVEDWLALAQTGLCYDTVQYFPVIIDVGIEHHRQGQAE